MNKYNNNSTLCEPSRGWELCCAATHLPELVPVTQCHNADPCSTPSLAPLTPLTGPRHTGNIVPDNSLLQLREVLIHYSPAYNKAQSFRSLSFGAGYLVWVGNRIPQTIVRKHLIQS